MQDILTSKDQKDDWKHQSGGEPLQSSQTILPLTHNQEFWDLYKKLSEKNKGQSHQKIYIGFRKVGFLKDKT